MPTLVLLFRHHASVRRLQHRSDVSVRKQQSQDYHRSLVNMFMGESFGSGNESQIALQLWSAGVRIRSLYFRETLPRSVQNQIASCISRFRCSSWRSGELLADSVTATALLNLPSTSSGFSGQSVVLQQIARL